MTDKNNPLQFATAFEWIGGAQQVQALTTRFYDLMALEPQFTALRAVHSPDLNSARDKLYLFLTGWLGGPQLYIEQHGHPRLRQRHMGFKIGVTERDQWVACMAQAMRDIGVPDDLFARLNESFYNTADWMRNQPDAVEGAPQMPTAAGAFQPQIKQKLHRILEAYGVTPPKGAHE